MTLYEMDWPDADDYIEKLYYPDCSVTLDCDYDNCEVVTSSWKNVSQWDPGIISTNAKIRLKITGAYLEWE